MISVVTQGRLDGPTNMARDISLLELAETGIASARVYEWDGPWVSLGRSQTPERALLNSGSVPFVKRPTGGKAVLHGHDVTVCFATPLAQLGLDESKRRSVVSVYRCIALPLVKALSISGVVADLGENTKFVRNAGHTADCFAHVSPNDIVNPATGIKVCGCALRLTSRAVLLQASIPSARPLVDPADLFENPGPVAWSSLGAREFAEAFEHALNGTASFPATVT